jgi:hypothetical protein
VTMLRHPAAVVDSKQRWYGGWQGDAGRAAGWINQTLFTERATREGPRAFVRYDDLLDDWTVAIARVGEALDLAVVRDAPANAMRAAHELVDRTLSRSGADWGDLRLPAGLREQADAVWALVAALAGDEEPPEARLDAARAAYVALYEEAEAIARSSIEAARRRAPAPAPAPALIRRVPRRYRRMVPLRFRSAVVRALAAR